MSLFVSILTAGTNNHQSTSEEANRFTTYFTTPGIVGTFTNTSGVAPMTGSFAVNPGGTAKHISISTGDAIVTTTPTGQSSQNLAVRNTAVIDYTHTDNVSGATKYDWVYLVNDATNANNPAVAADNVASIVVNRSTSATSDTSGAVPAFYEVLAIVTLVSGFTTVNNGNIAEKRRAAGAAVPDGSINVATKLSNPYKFGAYRSSSQGVGSGYARVACDVEEFDTGNNYDNTSAFRFTAPIAGFYHFDGAISSTSNATQFTFACLYKNGVIIKRGNQAYGNGTQFDANVSSTIQLAANDYVELYTYNGAAALLFGTQDQTYINGFLVSPS